MWTLLYYFPYWGAVIFGALAFLSRRPGIFISFVLATSLLISAGGFFSWSYGRGMSAAGDYYDLFDFSMIGVILFSALNVIFSIWLFGLSRTSLKAITVSIVLSFLSGLGFIIQDIIGAGGFDPLRLYFYFSGGGGDYTPLNYFFLLAVPQLIWLWILRRLLKRYWGEI